MSDGLRALNPEARACGLDREYSATSMRILVTGADGFLGGHIARGLEQSGHDVVRSVYARASRGSELRVDLASAPALTLLPRSIDAVVHAAGIVDGRATRAQMYAANVRATANLVAWAAGAHARHFVHLSSVAVYGPLALGEERDEQTLRLGLHLGLPYMRTKALAERCVEQSGVPYTLLRPPVVLGPGDTVISRGFYDALRAGGLPLVAGADPGRRVSVAFAEGLVEIIRRLLRNGPLWAPLHAVDMELSFGALARAYARLMGCPCDFASISWKQALLARDEVGFAWLVASARFGQHYLSNRLVSELGYHSQFSLESTIQSGLSSLQG